MELTQGRIGRIKSIYRRGKNDGPVKFGVEIFLRKQDLADTFKPLVKELELVASNSESEISPYEINNKINVSLVEPLSYNFF